MKRYLLTLITLLFFAPCMKAQNQMHIHMKNGSVLNILVSEVDSITWNNEVVDKNMPVGEAVDLGLSVKWASFNVGASSPEEYGYYYAWGETEPKSTYNWSTYKWCSNGSSTGITKYTFADGDTLGGWYNNGNYVGDNKTTLDPEDDAAHINWGGDWRMPTREEYDELKNNCTWTWTTQNGVNGYMVTSNKNGNTIFLPAAGYRYDSSFYLVGSYGLYCSPSLCSNYSGSAYYLEFGSGYVEWSTGVRCDGRSVRAVCP